MSKIQCTLEGSGLVEILLWLSRRGTLRAVFDQSSGNYALDEIAGREEVSTELKEQTLVSTGNRRIDPENHHLVIIGLASASKLVREPQSPSRRIANLDKLLYTAERALISCSISRMKSYKSINYQEDWIVLGEHLVGILVLTLGHTGDVHIPGEYVGVPALNLYLIVLLGSRSPNICTRGVPSDVHR